MYKASTCLRRDVCQVSGSTDIYPNCLFFVGLTIVDVMQCCCVNNSIWANFPYQAQCGFSVRDVQFVCVSQRGAPGVLRRIRLVTVAASEPYFFGPDKTSSADNEQFLQVHRSGVSVILFKLPEGI